MKIFFTCVMMCFGVILNAQSKINYTASLEAGIAKGNNDNSAVYFFSNGVSYKNISAGIGVGIDNYLIRSVPVFADIKKQFGHRKIKPFVGASAGVNVRYPTAEQKNSYVQYYQNGSFKNGFFTKAFVGASVPVYHKLCLFMNAGYSYKTIAVTYQTVFEPASDPASVRTDIYHLSRWFASLGFCF